MNIKETAQGMNIPVIDDIIEAHKRIEGIIHRTPVLTSSSINDITGCELYFKCENLQKVGAFKYRGATNAVFSLTDEEARKGVATHSSGNHAQALALAARKRGIKAYIVMPDNSPAVKKNAVAGYGAEITFCKPTLEARETTLASVVEKTGAAFIHPYDNFKIISGAGTAGKEFVEEIPGLDYVITPVGGGGLLSGTSISVTSLSPGTEVIAAEPEGADDAFRSFRDGKIYPSVNPDTIADGLLTSLGELNFEVIKKNVTGIFTVSDEYIVKAMRLIWERMKILVEPSAAVGLGIILQDKVNLKGKRTGIILSGGNIDLENLPWLVK